MANKKISVKERLRRAKQAGETLLPTRTMNVWLGADVGLLEEYAAAVAEAEQPQEPAGRGRRLGEPTPAAAARQRADELAVQLEEFRAPWKIRGLSDREWERLLAANPPRKQGDGVHPDDKVGWNDQSMPKALVRAGTVDSELDDEDWLTLLGDDETDGQLSPGQIDSISAAVFNLTRVAVDVPFSSAASRTTPSS